MQPVAPLAAAYVPAAHGMHAPELPAPTAADAVPTGQLTQAVAPVMAPKVPAAQPEQLDVRAAPVTAP